MYSKILHLTTFASLVCSQIYTINQDYREAISQLLELRVNDFDIYTKLINHGCWCGQIGKTNSLGGPALDDLDRFCKRWIEMRKCKGQWGRLVELGKSICKEDFGVEFLGTIHVFPSHRPL